MLKNKLLSTTVIIFFVLFMVALLIHWLLWSGDYISISPTEWHFAWLFFVIGSGILFWAIGISIWKDYKNNIKNHALYDQAHWFFVMVLSSWERVIIYSGLLFVIPIIYIGACSGLFSNHLWQSKGLVEFFSEIPYSWEDSVNAMITYTKITLFFYIFIFLYLIWVAGDIFGGVGGTATGNRNFYDEQRRNLIRSWVLFAINAIIFAFVGVAMGLLIHLWIKPLKFPYILWTPAMWEWSIIVIVTSILLVIWLIFYLVFYYQGLKYVSKAFGAREPTDEEKHRYGNIFKNMHISAGLIGEHSWKICDNEEPNAAAAGRNSTDSCIFVNTGLLRLLDDDELQAVIAHEVAHIRNRDSLVVMLAMLTLNIYVVLMEKSDLIQKVVIISLIKIWGISVYLFGKGSSILLERIDGKDHAVVKTSYVIGALMLFTTAIAFTIVVCIGIAMSFIYFSLNIVIIYIAYNFSLLISSGISKRREYAADAASTQLTMNPMSLVSALMKISNEPHIVPSEIATFSPLWIHNCQCTEDHFPKLIQRLIHISRERIYKTHPSTNSRIQRLRDMQFVASNAVNI